MKLLEEKIRSCGKVLNSEMLLVDMFLNNQVDCALMDKIADEFCRLFKNDNITRVATVEASGIAPATLTALKLGVPLVILKKQPSVILNTDLMQTEVFSFTKQTSYQLTLKPEFITKGDRVLLIDDFMANGEAAEGATRLITYAGGEVAGIGVVISKNFQHGIHKLREQGLRVESLAQILSMSPDHIKFAGE